MAKKPQSPADLSRVNIIGLPAEHAQRVRGLLAAMAPSVAPRTIFFLSDKDFSNAANQVARGSFNGRVVRPGEGSEERYGQTNGNTVAAGGFSIPAQGQIYVNARLLDSPKDLAQILGHELGHATADANNQSEAEANSYRDLYVKRAQQAQKIQAGVAQLQPNAQAVLSGALRGLRAEPQSPLANIAENNK